MSSVEQLKYKDDVDRRYGVAGMVLAAFILDYEKYISSVSIERSGLEAIEFSPDFFIVSGENVSAKTSWEHILEQYQVIASMMISNMMCRSMVGSRRELDRAMHDVMLSTLKDYAEDCQLEKDEAEAIFDKHYQYLNRAYHNSNLHVAAKRLVEELTSKPVLYHSDLCDLVRSL
jgi:hypothetical protein